MSDPKHVIIIGAGPGGLASAMLLARAGLRVTVLERQQHVGGRTRTFDQDGFRFDLGPTFFLYPRILEELFRSCGRELRREVDMVKLDPQYRLIFGQGGELSCTPDVARMEQEIARFAPDDAGAFTRFMRDSAAKFERFAPVLQRPFNNAAHLLSPNLFKLLPYLRPWRSLGAELERFFKDPRLQLAFTFQSKYLGMSPFNCPSLFSILSYLEYEHGVFHPIGGCGEISKAMARIAQDMGVDFRLGEPVTQFEFEGKRAKAVITEGGRYECDALVVNADFARAMTSLVPDRLRPRWTDRKIAKKRFSCSTYMLYLGIDGRYDDLEHHTIYISEDYRKNLREIERDHVLSEDPSVYIQNASVTDPTLAPRGQSTLYVLVPVSNQHPNIDWSVERDRYRAVAMRQLRKIGLHDVEQRIRTERVITPADWDSGENIHLGATFNLAHSLNQMLHRRPQNRFRDLDGVYIVGGGTHPGSGLPVIYEGARISSRLLLQDLAVDTGFLDVPARPLDALPPLPVREANSCAVPLPVGASDCAVRQAV